MYKVDFGEVLGTCAIAKDNCKPATKEEILVAAARIDAR